MRRLFAVARPFSLLVLLLMSLPAHSQDVAARLDEYMRAQVEANGFSGAVLVARDGNVVFRGAWGPADAARGVANTPRTRFRLGSVTKQFTAASILILESRGKLSISDPVCKYVENCPPAWQPLTIHHLLTHTSGIPNFTSFPDYVATMNQPSPPAKTLERFRGRPLEFVPGEKFSYSNSGYVLLGYILEKATGEPYEQFLKKNIFDPLEMLDTGYDDPSKAMPNRAVGYLAPAGTPRPALPIDMTIPHAAGALYSTVEDLLKWDRALYTDRILSASTRERVFAPGKGNYGYGWMIDKMANRKMIGHGGGINGFSSFIARFPEDRSVIIVLRNQEGGTGLVRDIAAVCFGEKYEIPKKRNVAAVAPAVLDAYVGGYELSPNFILTVRRDGERLLTRATGQPEVEVFPESETKFLLKVVDAQITFVLNSEGKVGQLILHQGGRDMPARKIR